MPTFLDFQTLKRINIDSVSWSSSEEEDGSKHKITYMEFARTPDKASTALFRAAANGERGNALVTLSDGRTSVRIRLKTAFIDYYSNEHGLESFSMKFIMAVFQ